ncbi:MAG: HAD-IA family hydrolase [Acidobacteriia bacterium]|nr:HAD-IA family hydrolase [Terriglobia bacterium]
MISVRTPVDFSQARLLIFDLDGTLIDSREDLANTANHMRVALGLLPLDHGTIFSYVGDGARLLVQRLLDHSTDDAVVDRGLQIFLNFYRDHMLEHTVLYPGVLEGLEGLSLSSDGARRTFVVLSNKPVRSSRMILEGLGVSDFFRYIYGGNSFELKKPDPMGIHTILDETGLPARAALMVGDSDVDVLTGRNAGVATCGVTYGLGSEKMMQTPPDVYVDDLRELAALLNGQTLPADEHRAGTHTPTTNLGF